MLEAPDAQRFNAARPEYRRSRRPRSTASQPMSSAVRRILTLPAFVTAGRHPRRNSASTLIAFQLRGRSGAQLLKRGFSHFAPWTTSGDRRCRRFASSPAPAGSE